MGGFWSKPESRNDMSTKTIDRLVSEMKNDPVLLKNWRKVARELGLSVDVISKHEKMYANDRTYEDILRSIVEHWLSITANADVQTFCEVLRETGFVRVAENIDHRKNNKMDGRRIQHDVGKEFSDFHGREEELEELHKSYEDHKSPFFIHGAAGYGKTELAKKFARTVIKEYNVNLFFLHGDSDSKLEEGIKQTYEEVTETKIVGTGKTFHTDLVSDLSRLSGRIVLIIDNVDRSNKIFESFLYSIKKVATAFVVVTTRDLVAVGRHTDENIGLNVFKRETSKEMVKNLLKTETDQDIDMLCDKLKDCPLALVQATSCIKKFKLKSFVGMSYDIREYLKNLKAQPYEILDPKTKDKQKSLYKIIGLSITNIESDPTFGRLAKRLIQLLAFLDPDGVHVDSLKRIYVRAYPDQTIDIEPGISLLQSYSIIKLDRHIIFTHRMTQKIVRLLVLQEESNNGDSKMIDVLVAILEKLKDDFTASEKFQVIKLWDNVYKLGGATDIKDRYITFPIFISDRLIELAFFSIANQFCAKYIKRLESICEDVNEKTLKLEYNTLRSLNYQGDRDKLFTEFSNLLKKVKGSIGEQHELCWEVRLELACLMRNLGQLNESLEEYKKIFEHCRSKFGPNSALTLRALHGQAICQMKQRRFVEAAEAFLEVVQKRKINFTQMHPSYIRAFCFLGECKYEMKDFSESKHIFLDALKIQFDCKDLYHPEHELMLKALYFFLKSTQMLGDSSDMQGIQLCSVFKDDKFYIAILQGLIDKLDKDKQIDDDILLLSVLEIKHTVLKKDNLFDDELQTVETRLDKLRYKLSNSGKKNSMK